MHLSFSAPPWFAGALTSVRSALTHFFNGTGGLDWARSEGWSTTRDPSQWLGVTMARDTVTELRLAQNKLEGARRGFGIGL